MDNLILNINRDGISSVNFEISLDSNSTIVTMTRPFENSTEFFEERDRFSENLRKSSFHWDVSSFNSLIMRHGVYSEKTMADLELAVDALAKASVAVSSHREEIVEKLKEVAMPVLTEHKKEAEQFATFLADFDTHIVTPYKAVGHYLMDKVCPSAENLNMLIKMVYQYRGNPTKIGYKWLDLFLFEGTLDHFISTLNTEEQSESKERLEALASGVGRFLQLRETELHAVVDKVITKKPLWVQKFYHDYKSMLHSGKPPHHNLYGPEGNINLYWRLLLPTRLAK